MLAVCDGHQSPEWRFIYSRVGPISSFPLLIFLLSCSHSHSHSHIRRTPSGRTVVQTMASAKHKSSPSYASAATSSATSTSTATGPMVSYHTHHPLNSRPSITLSREASPPPRASMSALHRPAFVHATTSYAIGAAAGTAAGSSYASGHGSRGESRGGSSKPFDDDGGYVKEVSAYYPPESPHPHRPYPYPHYQYTPFAQPDRPAANTCAMDRLKTSVRTMCGANGDRESKLACLQCSSAEEGGQLGKIMMWAWVVTTVGFFLAIAFWRGELFRGKFSIQEDSSCSMNACIVLTLLAQHSINCRIIWQGKGYTDT